MPAFEVHGLSTEFLRDKPRFAELADDMLAFIEGAMLVMHNAAFDFGFLNAELDRLARPLLRWDCVVDTLALARRRHPGAPCSLDALCKRYGIDLSEREKHGALLDCRLLAARLCRAGRRSPGAARVCRQRRRRRSCSEASAEAVKPRDQAAGAAADGGGDRSASRLRRTLGAGRALAPLLTAQFLAAPWVLAASEILGVEPAEIDRVEHQRREAAVAVTSASTRRMNGKQKRRAIDEQHRLEQVLRHVAQAEQPAIDQLDIVDDALVALGVDLEMQRDLVGLLAARARHSH